MRTVSRVYRFAMLALFGAAGLMAVVNAPDDPVLGTARHALYLHLPFAVNAYLCCLAAFVAAIGFLATREMWWDRLAAASAWGAAAASTIVLATGMVLARSAWGHWWAWTPKLTFSLTLWLLLLGYLLIRALVCPAPRRAVVAAVYAAVVLLDAPLVYLSIKLLPDAHPTSANLDPGAQVTLLVCVLSVTMLSTGVIASTVRGHGVQQDRIRRGTENPRAATDGGGIEHQPAAGAGVGLRSAGAPRPTDSTPMPPVTIAAGRDPLTKAL